MFASESRKPRKAGPISFTQLSVVPSPYGAYGVGAPQRYTMLNKPENCAPHGEEAEGVLCGFPPCISTGWCCGKRNNI